MSLARKVDLDRVGACASAVCAVHCLITGVAFGILSVVGLGFLGSRPAEIGFICFSVSVGSLAVFAGYRKHRSWLPALIFAAGVGAVASSHFLLNHDTPLGTTLAVLGGLCLVAFHVVNQRLQQASGHCTH